MGISRTCIRPTEAPFYDIVPRKHAEPLGQIHLPVTFGTPLNFRREMLTFEVVRFLGSYHAILGRSCYAKFMAVPNYTYLKLKMPGPKGVITVGTSLQHSYECEVESCELASTTVAFEELTAILHADDEVTDPKKATGSFKPTEDTKEVLVDPSSTDGKTLRISSSLGNK